MAISVAMLDYRRVSSVEHGVSRPEIGLFEPTITVVESTRLMSHGEYPLEIKYGWTCLHFSTGKASVNGYFDKDFAVAKGHCRPR